MKLRNSLETGMVHKHHFFHPPFPACVSPVNNKMGVIVFKFDTSKSYYLFDQLLLDIYRRINNEGEGSETKILLERPVSIVLFIPIFCPEEHGIALEIKKGKHNKG